MHNTAEQPGWVEHVVWWHVYPLGFAGADTTGADRTGRPGFEQLTSWLDHVVRLGANGIALGPVFESGTHGYDTVDYLRIDPRLGDRNAFDRFVAAARERGVRILLDGVFNHVGREFVGGPGLLRRNRDGGPATFEGHDQLVALDHAQPAVVDLVVEVMTHWLDAGVDGWRLDAAYAVPVSFWAQVLPRVRERHPDAYVLGEMLHGDYSAYVRESGIDSVTQYELWKAIWSSLDSRNFFELDWTLQRHNALLDTFVPYTFVGNHDVTRLASAVRDPRHRAHAIVLLMTLGGTPAVYVGDELGFTGVKEERAGGDDAVRPAMPPQPDVEQQNEVLTLHQELIGLRRRHPWLHRARSRSVTLRNEALVLEVGADGSSLTVALNLADEPLPVTGTELLAGHAERTGDGWSVPGHGWAVLAGG